MATYSEAQFVNRHTKGRQVGDAAPRKRGTCPTTEELKADSPNHTNALSAEYSWLNHIEPSWAGLLRLGRDCLAALRRPGPHVHPGCRLIENALVSNGSAPIGARSA
jgi:hypothetical protein